MNLYLASFIDNSITPIPWGSYRHKIPLLFKDKHKNMPVFMPHDLCMFRFMITIIRCLVFHVGGHSQNAREDPIGKKVALPLGFSLISIPILLVI
jgi:hypothetical protein